MKLLVAAIILAMVPVAYAGVYYATKDIVPMTHSNKDYEQQTTTPITLIPIPTLPPVNQSAIGTSTTTKPHQVDCVGPDGIQFKTTQAECDKLNSAWNKPIPTTQPNNTDYLYPRLKTYPLYIPPTHAPDPTVQLLPTIPPYQPLPTRPPANVYWHPNPPAPTVPYGFSN